MADNDDEGPAVGGLGGLFAQLEQAQELIQTAAAEASSTIVEGSAGDGRVVVQMSGDLDAVSVHIDPSLVDPSDVGMLEDLVLAAIRDGLGQIADLQEQVAGAFGAGSGGLDVASLLGSLGNVPGLGNSGDLGSFGTFDIEAMAEMPELGALGGLTAAMAESDDDDDDDDDADEEDDLPSGGSGLGHAEDPAAGGGGGTGATGEGGTGEGGTGDGGTGDGAGPSGRG